MKDVTEEPNEPIILGESQGYTLMFAPIELQNERVLHAFLELNETQCKQLKETKRGSENN